MMRLSTCVSSFVLLIQSLCAAESLSPRDANWHQWRGPQASGVAIQGDPPVHWDQLTNVKWKVAIDGESSATPIVWDQQVFLVTAIETERIAEQPPQADERAKTQPPANFYQFVVMCLDRQTGSTRWRHVACEAVPHEGRHPTNSYASGSPTTDGKRLYVSFGSRGIYCYDLDGVLLWQRDLGDMRTRAGWGEAVTPVVYRDRLIVNWDHEDQSFITVLNAESGETQWRADRDEPTSWTSPLVVEHKGRTQMIVNGTNRVRSYDLATGELIWQCGGQTVNAIPSPVVAGQIVFCTSGYQGSAMYAISLDATGDITGSDQIVWSHHQGTPYVPSPIIVDKRIFFTRTNTAVLTGLDIATGKPTFGPQRLPGLTDMYASPAAAGGRIYFVGRDGTTVVIDARSMEVLGTNVLNDPIDASPAIVGNQLFLRSAHHVYCLQAE